MGLLTHTVYWWLLQLIFCYVSVLMMLRLFGAKGVAVLMGVMVIAANIQVLKLFHIPGVHQVLPLGTAFMATSYLASDMLAQYYDLKTAKTAINMAIAAFILLFIAMFFTIHFPVVSLADQQSAGVDNQNAIQEAMKTLFSPAPKLFLCSMISFWISQRLEIFIFSGMRTWLGEKKLWLRNNISTWVAALCDNTIFSVLMWRLWADEPVSWHVLIVGYIFGTYLLRVLMAILDTPMIYLAKFCLPKK
jgi:uncharacterized integral membrane protein (TIGR00697 family)